MRRDDDNFMPWWLWVIALLLGVFGVAWSCSERKKCEARGGVYLSRDLACVAPPPPGAP